MRNPLEADILIPFVERHKTKFLLVGVGIPSLILVAYFFWPLATDIFWVFTEPTRRVAFDSAKWKDKSTLHAKDAIRIRMIDDLMNRYDFRGKSQEEVTELLGEPSRTGMFPGWDLVYLLGPERSLMSIDSEWLAFKLDEQKQVTEWKVVRD